MASALHRLKAQFAVGAAPSDADLNVAVSESVCARGEAVSACLTRAARAAGETGMNLQGQYAIAEAARASWVAAGTVEAPVEEPVAGEDSIPQDDQEPVEVTQEPPNEPEMPIAEETRSEPPVPPMQAEPTSFTGALNGYLVSSDYCGRVGGSVGRVERTGALYGDSVACVTHLVPRYLAGLGLAFERFFRDGGR